MNARIFDSDGQVLIFTAKAEDQAAEFRKSKTVEVVESPVLNGKIDLMKVMLELGNRQMNEILLEAGSILCGNMLSSGLVDELVVYLSPDALGNDAKGMFAIPGMESLSDRINLEFRESVMVGRDLKLTLGVNRSV